jgi:hypothetical protein
MKAFWLLPTNCDIYGFSLLNKILEITLYKILQTEMGLKSVTFFGSGILGINTMLDLAMLAGIMPVSNNPWTFLTITARHWSQNVWTSLTFNVKREW